MFNNYEQKLPQTNTAVNYFGEDGPEFTGNIGE